MQTIFGPVSSRRFGTSLGVDLSPALKQCNFDCLYCELAPAQPVTKQKEVVAVKTVVDELKKHLNDEIDVITLTANGEPTLYPHLRELIKEIDKIKKNTKTLILTNSSTLTDSRVFETLKLLDQVKLSLDAVSANVFKKIDRPAKDVNIDEIIKALQRFSEEYTKELFIEILFVKGLNDTKEEITKLNETLLRLHNVKRIDIGTIDRPPAYPVEALEFNQLHAIAELFDASLPIHIASRKSTKPTQRSYTQEEILNTLDKRPLTKEDIELLFDVSSQEIFQKLLQNGQITTKKVDKIEFFLPSKNFLRKRAKNS